MQKVRNPAARLVLRAPHHQNCTPLLQQLHWLQKKLTVKYKTASHVATLSQVPPSPICLSYCTFTFLPALSALHQTHACSNSNASPAKSMVSTHSHTSAPTSGTIFPNTSGILLLSLPSKSNLRHFTSRNMSVKQHCPTPLSVCTMYMRMCACVHLAHSYAWTLVDVYIMC